MVRALASHARGRRFESYCLYHQTANEGASCALFACLALGTCMFSTFPALSHLKVPNLQPFLAVWIRYSYKMKHRFVFFSLFLSMILSRQAHVRMSTL